MRLRFSILILFSVLSITIRGQEQKWEPSSLMGLTFKEFVAITQNSFKIRIFYKDEWVEGLTTAKYPEDFTLNKVLDSLFSGRHIFYFHDRSGNIVLTKDFAIKRFEGPITGNEEFIPPSSVRDVSEDHEVKENQFIVIGKPTDRNLPGKATVSGFITNSVTHLAVSGATIIEKQLRSGAAFR